MRNEAAIWMDGWFTIGSYVLVGMTSGCHFLKLSFCKSLSLCNASRYGHLSRRRSFRKGCSLSFLLGQSCLWCMVLCADRFVRSYHAGQRCRLLLLGQHSIALLISYYGSLETIVHSVCLLLICWKSSLHFQNQIQILHCRNRCTQLCHPWRTRHSFAQPVLLLLFHTIPILHFTVLTEEMANSFRSWYQTMIYQLPFSADAISWLPLFSSYFPLFHSGPWWLYRRRWLLFQMEKDGLQKYPFSFYLIFSFLFVSETYMSYSGLIS